MGRIQYKTIAIEGSNVDVSGISKNDEQIAVVNEKVDGLDLSQIAVLEEKIKKLESKSVDTSGIAKNAEAINEVDKKATVNEKTLQLFKLEIEELKLKAKNPLAN